MRLKGRKGKGFDRQAGETASGMCSQALKQKGMQMGGGHSRREVGNGRQVGRGRQRIREAGEDRQTGRPRERWRQVGTEASRQAEEAGLDGDRQART